jgi:hypothetical protein
MNGTGDGTDPRSTEYVQGSVLLICISGVAACMIASFFWDPKYDKGVYIGLTSLISIATGILFGRAVSTPVYPTVAPPIPTITTTTATADPAKVVSTTAPAGTPVADVKAAVEAATAGPDVPPVPR